MFVGAVLGWLRQRLVSQGSLLRRILFQGAVDPALVHALQRGRSARRRFRQGLSGLASQSGHSTFRAFLIASDLFTLVGMPISAPLLVPR